MHLQLVQGSVQVTQPLESWFKKKNFGPKNARVSPDFLKMAIFRKKFTKK